MFEVDPELEYKEDGIVVVVVVDGVLVWDILLRIFCDNIP